MACVFCNALMSAAQTRAVGTLVFGGYNIANVRLRQEKFHADEYTFSRCDENCIKRLCGFFKKELELFLAQAYVDACIRPRHAYEQGGPDPYFIWLRKKKEPKRRGFTT